MSRARQYPGLILALVCLPVFIGALDLTIVSAVLPAPDAVDRALGRAGRGSPAVPGAAEVVDHDLGALRGEGQGVRPADAVSDLRLPAHGVHRSRGSQIPHRRRGVATLLLEKALTDARRLLPEIQLLSHTSAIAMTARTTSTAFWASLQKLRASVCT